MIGRLKEIFITSSNKAVETSEVNTDPEKVLTVQYLKGEISLADYKSELKKAKPRFDLVKIADRLHNPR